MSTYFLEITSGGLVSISGAELGCYVTVRNKNNRYETNKKGSREVI